MNESTRDRLIGFDHAFDNPVTLWITVALAALLAISIVMIFVLRAAGVVQPKTFSELIKRWLSWCVLVPSMLLPVLAGAAPFILGIGLLSALCFLEFSRVVGIRQERAIVAAVLVGIGLLTFATLDNWYGFFVALFPLSCLVIAAVALLDDRPRGYVSRVALGVWGFAMCASSPAHLGYLANDVDYRPLVILILLSVELNDIFAYCCGKLFGRRKLAPQISPNKTLAGSLGAMCLTTTLFAGLGYLVFAGTPLAHPSHLVVMGLMVSLLGQLGDLMLSSVKRDVGVKDMGTVIPGHGGLLDRFDSLLLVAPAMFHYVHYFRGVGLDEIPRIFSR